MQMRMGERQRWMWLLSGVSAAVAARGCGLGWLWVLAGSIPATVYYIYMDKSARPCGTASQLISVFGRGGKTLAALTLLWTIIALAWTADLAHAAFPMVSGFPVLGWVMLVLAAWGSRKGAAVCARCAGILCLFLLVLYGVVVIFALPDVQISNLWPFGAGKGGIDALALCLLPACVWFLPCRTRGHKPAWGLGLILILGAALLSAVTAGVLSPLLAASLPAPLYALAQSISLFGVLERIEPLLSAAMVMGVFCLLSAMVCTCRALADEIYKTPWSAVGSCVAAGLIMGVVRDLPVVFLAGGTVLFWVALPLFVQWRGKTPRNSG